MSSCHLALTPMVYPLHERLGIALARSGVSAQEVDRLAGRPTNHGRLIASGVRPNPETATLAAYALTLGLSLDWLVFGRGMAPTDAKIRAAVERAKKEPGVITARLEAVLGPLRKQRSKAKKAHTSRSPRPKEEKKITPASPDLEGKSTTVPKPRAKALPRKALSVLAPALLPPSSANLTPQEQRELMTELQSTAIKQDAREDRAARAARRRARTPLSVPPEVRP